MPVVINGHTYYRTAEVFRKLGISRNTLYRWLQKDILSSGENRDSRGWRLFTRDEIEELNSIINCVTRIERQTLRETGDNHENQ